ncbi:hypothetical protein VC34_07715 [Pseudomonas fluorescens]|uniref:Uncharacterized protein n=1 Tax=Pseudomonas fluorescens TaxID=294 RepID=A0A0F4TQ82_PSEFL|nr:hypothetical protein VC34_07715 [Pseudomonas fluorescens]
MILILAGTEIAEDQKIAAFGSSYMIGVSVGVIGLPILVVPVLKVAIDLSKRFALAFELKR